MTHKDFEVIDFRERKTCGVCEASLDSATISLPRLPLTEILVPQLSDPIGFLDQNFCYCERCGHGQLSRIVPPEILYSGEYSFRTSNSGASVQGNTAFIDFITESLGNREYGSIADIGCNDLFMLKALENKGEQLFGIDPMLGELGVEAPSSKYRLIGDFIENVAIENLISERGTLFVCSHNLEHIESPKQMVARLLSYANDKTVFAFQFPGLEALVRNTRFDQIFHHHLQYFSLASVKRLLAECGGELLYHTTNEGFWGSLLVIFKKGISEVDPGEGKFTEQDIRTNYARFQADMAIAGEYVKSSRKERLLGYGAALTLPTVAYHLKHDFSNFECIVDDDPNKNNLYYLNLPVQIRNFKSVGPIADATVMVTALNNVRQIVPKLIELRANKIIVPLSRF